MGYIHYHYRSNNKNIYNIKKKKNGNNNSTFRFNSYNNREYVALNVLPASSFLLMDNGVDVPSGATGAATFVDIQLISGQSSSATDAIDVEFVMVTT